MDAGDQARVFERVQETFNIDEITQTNINDFLGNKPGTREYEWDERRKSGALRHRVRKYTASFSSKKDAIAKDLSKISTIYSDSKSIETKDKFDKAKDDYEEFKSKWKLTSTNLGKMDSNFKEGVFTITDKYMDSYNISGFKTLRQEVKDPALNETIGNYEFMMFRARRMELRDSGDISGLERLKDDVRGARDESELIDDINYDIDKIQG